MTDFSPREPKRVVPILGTIYADGAKKAMSDEDLAELQKRVDETSAAAIMLTKDELDDAQDEVQQRADIETIRKGGLTPSQIKWMGISAGLIGAAGLIKGCGFNPFG